MRKGSLGNVKVDVGKVKKFTRFVQDRNTRNIVDKGTGSYEKGVRNTQTEEQEVHNLICSKDRFSRFISEG